MAIEPIFESYGNKLIGTSPVGGGDIDASDVTYNETTVEAALDQLSTDVSDRVSKANGGTFNGNVIVDRKDGTTTVIGQSELILGNNIAEGTAKNSKGILRIYGKGAYKGNIGATNLTANRNFELPDKNGTIALTNDMPIKSTGNTGVGKTVTITPGSGTNEALFYIFRSNASTDYPNATLQVVSFQYRSSAGLVGNKALIGNPTPCTVSERVITIPHDDYAYITVMSPNAFTLSVS